LNRRFFLEIKGVLFREVKGVKEVVAGCRLLEVKDITLVA